MMKVCLPVATAANVIMRFIFVLSRKLPVKNLILKGNSMAKKDHQAAFEKLKRGWQQKLEFWCRLGLAPCAKQLKGFMN